MDKEARIALTKFYPQMKCLWCNHLALDRKRCLIAKEPLTCGRDFSPSGGLTQVDIDPPTKPKPKDGVEMKIPIDIDKENVYAQKFHLP